MIIYIVLVLLDQRIGHRLMSNSFLSQRSQQKRVGFLLGKELQFFDVTIITVILSHNKLWHEDILFCVPGQQCSRDERSDIEEAFQIS